jgi:hypothetical protein
MDESYDYFVVNCARYRGLICGRFGVIEEIKTPVEAGVLL